jgi:hypothetical protein
MGGLEGALITTPDRNVGSIVVNSRSHPVRRRFTLAHELGHFLNPWHRPSDSSSGFSCTRGDLGNGWRRGSAPVSRHVAQEIEANRFAIELLAPAPLVRRHLSGIPDLAKVMSSPTTSDSAARRARGVMSSFIHGRPGSCSAPMRRALCRTPFRFFLRKLPARSTPAGASCPDGRSGSIGSCGGRSTRLAGTARSRLPRCADANSTRRLRDHLARLRRNRDRCRRK